MDFLADFFWTPLFGGISCSYCRKTHTENFGEEFGGKFRENIPFLGVFFGELFGPFSVSNFWHQNRKIRRMRSARETP